MAVEQIFSSVDVEGWVSWCKGHSPTYSWPKPAR
jgi:hypothetical protein